MPIEEKNAVCAKDFALADLVQGIRSGSPGSSAPRSGPSSFASGHIRQSDRSGGNISFASLPGVNSKSDHESQMYDDQIEDSGQTENEF